MTPYEKARQAFDDNLGELQGKLCAWEAHNFGAQPRETGALGVLEEIGELAETVLALAAWGGRLSHATLKAMQKIRGMHDEQSFREAAADAIADIGVFCVNLCTKLRLDYQTLLTETAHEVMKRDFTKNAATGDVAA